MTRRRAIASEAGSAYVLGSGVKTTSVTASQIKNDDDDDDDDDDC